MKEEKMEIGYIIKAENDSGQLRGTEFINKHPTTLIPYLMFLTLAIVCGTIGNFLIITVIIVDKVSNNYFVQVTYFLIL